jgi:hypothetical protein
MMGALSAKARYLISTRLELKPAGAVTARPGAGALYGCMQI